MPGFGKSFTLPRIGTPLGPGGKGSPAFFDRFSRLSTRSDTMPKKSTSGTAVAMAIFEVPGAELPRLLVLEQNEKQEEREYLGMNEFLAWSSRYAGGT